MAFRVAALEDRGYEFQDGVPLVGSIAAERRKALGAGGSSSGDIAGGNEVEEIVGESIFEDDEFGCDGVEREGGDFGGVGRLPEGLDAIERHELVEFGNWGDNRAVREGGVELLDFGAPSTSRVRFVALVDCRLLRLVEVLELGKS